MKPMNIARVSLQCFANLFLVIGVCLTLAAMFTARWQVANLPDGEIYEHGLYRDCDNTKSNIKSTGQWLCFWKYDQVNRQNIDKSYQLQNYQVACLVLFGAACGLAVLAIICAYVTCCVKYCSIPWTVSSFLAALTSLAALIVFMKNAGERANRFYRKANYEVEQSYGASFEMAVSGFVLFIVATFIAGGCIALVFIESRQNRGVRSDNYHTGGTILLDKSTKV